MRRVLRGLEQPLKYSSHSETISHPAEDLAGTLSQRKEMMTMSTTLITSRDPKGLQIANLFDTTLNKAKLDHERAQRLIENGGEFQDGLNALIERLSATNQYADEEVESNYGYLSGYRQPKTLDQQVKLLQGFFPNISGVYKKEVAEQSLPPNAEGWFAIPRWEVIARWQRSPERRDEAPLYEEALVKMFQQLSSSRGGKFYNYREGAMGSDRLRLVTKTQSALAKFAEQQEGYPILVVPCQFGLRHRGRSVRRAREVMPVHEFGLDPFSVACMLLTHPERLKHYDDLWIDCAGTDYDHPGGAAPFAHAPYFFFCVGKVKFDTFFSDYAHELYGAASGFVPQ
jgi:hypothetical protein